MLNPIGHAEQVTGCRQVASVDRWASSGVAVGISDVTGPRVYDYGTLPVATVAATLYNVRRHVLIEDGQVRRDGRVRAGRFRIGQPGRQVLVDAVPERGGKLLIMYLEPGRLGRLAAEMGWRGPVELVDPRWDEEDTFLHLLSRRLVEAEQDGCTRDGLFGDQLALTLAMHVLQRYAFPQVRPARAGSLPSARVARVVDYVRSRPGERLATADLAAVAGLSPSHFLRQFQAATGMTPHRLVTRERVAAAKDLLAGSRMPIAEVALACGFSSQAHLGTAFRAETGMTPARYRRATAAS